MGFGFGMACLRRATFSFRLIGTGTGFSTFLSLHSLSGFRSRLFFVFLLRGRITDYAWVFFLLP